MDKALLDQAKESLAIVDVYLHSSQVRTADTFYPFLEQPELRVQFKNFIKQSLPVDMDEGKSNGPRNFVVFHYVAALRMLSTGVTDEDLKDEAKAGEKTLAEVVATFAALYEVKNPLSKEAIDEFAKYNVGYHVWPYWREFASSIGSRLRLPTFSVPMYRIPKD